jgi:hypothetical protein
MQAARARDPVRVIVRNHIGLRISHLAPKLGRPAPTSTTGNLRCSVRCIAVINTASCGSSTYWSSSIKIASAVPAAFAASPTCSKSACKSCSSDVDNAATESFFSTLKTERTERRSYRTRNEARADVFSYIEQFYNSRRRHSRLGYMSPAEYERANGH